MRRYRDYDVYRVALDFVDEIYHSSRVFPIEERFGLQSQLRRAAVSIPSNIAEGAGRKSERDFARFVRHAAGSVNEVRCQLEIAARQGFLRREEWQELDALCDRLQALIHGLLRRLGPADQRRRQGGRE